MNTKLYFSVLSGELYYISEDEIKNLDSAQIPLKKKPSSSCKKCYGRFYVGKDIATGQYAICPRCARRCIDWDVVGDDGITIEQPRSTNEIADHNVIGEIKKADEMLLGD